MRDGVWALLMFLGMHACAVSAQGGEVDPAAFVRQAREDLAPISFTRDTVWTPAMLAYRRFYGLEIPGVTHRFGTFKTGVWTLAVHAYEPRVPSATVLIVHGYYDHAGVMQHVIRHLVAKNCRVVIYDQPGHGLSSGKRVTIQSFGQYVTVLRAMVDLVTQQYGTPPHIVAHSMGCAAATDYLLGGESAAVGRVVFLAPLMRSAHWRASGVGTGMMGVYTDTLPRVFRRNSSDEAFLDFTRADPLQDHVVPIQWLQALRRWNRRLQILEPSDRRMLIIQGTADSTVDWKYSLKILRGKFPNARIERVEGAGHQLMNETPGLRAQILEKISAELLSMYPADRQ